MSGETPDRVGCERVDTGQIPNRREYVIRGVPEDAGWREAWEREGRPDPYCRITVYFPTDGREPWLGAFGGEVWPGAWPSLFTVHEPTKMGQSTTVTPSGLALLLAAG